eukprot:9100071-Alexandrium_andersonii.AAC.1
MAAFPQGEPPRGLGPCQAALTPGGPCRHCRREPSPGRLRMAANWAVPSAAKVLLFNWPIDSSP